MFWTPPLTLKDNYIKNGMKEIKLIKKTAKIIGAVRVSEELFNKVKKLAKEHGVTNQDIVRTVLENCIDDIKLV